MVYEAGTASVTASTIGLGHALVAAGTSGRQQTELAKVPPGRAPTYFVLGLACFGLLLVATGWPLFGAVLAGGFRPGDGGIRQAEQGAASRDFGEIREDVDLPRLRA
jgi:hypothetical protein